MMIFATVGTQLPFDRLLSALDNWAASHPEVSVKAQTGRTDQKFAHMECAESLGQTDFTTAFETARVIVAHAGMGSILSASELGKPILLMPRRAAMGEHRNDHQLDTAAEMAALPNVTVVQDANDLAAALDRILAQPQTGDAGSAFASEQLINNLKHFIFATTPQETQA
jgi:UDP-N-acetylglucosamine transferase subunit ALG13